MRCMCCHVIEAFCPNFQPRDNAREACLTLRPNFTLEIGAAAAAAAGRQEPRRALRARGCRSAAAGQTTSGNARLLQFRLKRCSVTCFDHLVGFQHNVTASRASLPLPGCAAPLYVSLRCFNNKAWGPHEVTLPLILEQSSSILLDQVLAHAARAKGSG